MAKTTAVARRKPHHTHRPKTVTVRKTSTRRSVGGFKINRPGLGRDLAFVGGLVVAPMIAAAIESRLPEKSRKWVNAGELVIGLLLMRSRHMLVKGAAAGLAAKGGTGLVQTIMPHAAIKGFEVPYLQEGYRIGTLSEDKLHEMSSYGLADPNISNVWMRNSAYARGGNPTGGGVSGMFRDHF